MGVEIRRVPQHTAGKAGIINQSRIWLYQLSPNFATPEKLNIGLARMPHGIQPCVCLEAIDISCCGTSNGNVICLGNNEIIANAAENAEAIQALEKKELMVHGIDLSEFRKGAGDPTCLILPVERK